MLHIPSFKHIKFPTLEISTEWGSGFTDVPYDIFRGIYLCCNI